MSPAAIYLHGFASGTTSGKARFFSERLRARGIELVTPDLNLPDFSTLTVTRMLEQTHALLEASADPVILIGSSLGGFVAVNSVVAQPDRVSHLVLLAPAVDFGIDRPPRTPLDLLKRATLDEWRRTGAMSVFHHSYGRTLPVHYALVEDAQRYDAWNAPVDVPTIVFQGRRDMVVDPEGVEQWAKARPNVELHLVDDDHQLTASLPFIWDHTARFLNLQP